MYNVLHAFYRLLKSLYSGLVCLCRHRFAYIYTLVIFICLDVILIVLPDVASGGYPEVRNAHTDKTVGAALVGHNSLAHRYTCLYGISASIILFCSSNVFAWPHTLEILIESLHPCGDVT